MKLHPWFIPWVAARIVGGSVLCCAAVAQPISPPVPDVGQRPAMSQMLDAAWQRSIESSESVGRRHHAAAEQSAASNWLAGPPALEVSQRNGRGQAADGSRETEIGVALPLWRFGQRQSQSQAAQAEADWAATAERAARWRLAGQLRDAAGLLRASEAEVRQVEANEGLLQRLSDDVDRRVRAGDLAPADAMAARADLLAVRSQVVDARHRLQAQLATWHVMTGTSVSPAPEPDIAAQRFIEDHPEVRLSAATVERARLRVAQEQARRGEPPELGVRMRQERPSSGESTQNSVGLTLRLPLGTDSYRQPQLAAALSEHDVALAALHRAQRQAEADLAAAQRNLKSAIDQVDVERERAALLKERANLINKSFLAGESPLPDLLRALVASAQAETSVVRLQAARALAQTRVQQAAGLLP